MMIYKFKVWCNTCFEDEYGCFPGGDDIKEIEADSVGQAFDMMYDWIKGAPWDFEPVDFEEPYR